MSCKNESLAAAAATTDRVEGSALRVSVATSIELDTPAAILRLGESAVPPVVDEDPRAELDPVVVWEQVVNPMHVQALCGRATSDAEARQLVALALAGAAPMPPPA